MPYRFNVGVTTPVQDKDVGCFCVTFIYSQKYHMNRQSAYRYVCSKIKENKNNIAVKCGVFVHVTDSLYAFGDSGS